MDRSTPSSARARWSAIIACGLLVGATLCGIAGTDLVLPAVPDLPAALGGTLAEAQLVLAAYVAGTAAGLLLFGALGDRFDRRTLLALSLFAFAATSAACAWAWDIRALICLRFVQGVASAAGAVFAPGMIRRLFNDRAAVQAIGLLGSIESLAPALAPILGGWLLVRYGWTASFDVTALLAVILAVAVLAGRRFLPAGAGDRGNGGYGTLLRNKVFLRYALSQAFTLGALLIFVFGAPVVIVQTMGGTLNDFIIMQVCGVTSFIVTVLATSRLVGRFGTEPLILAGTVLALPSALGLLAYGLLGGDNLLVLAALFAPMNIGLGLRGPPGFLRAIIAARGDDARGAALVILAVLGVTAVGTALLAPFITAGLPALAGGSAAVHLAAIVTLLVLPALDEGRQ